MMNAWKNIPIRLTRLSLGRSQEKKMKNCTPHTIVFVPDGVKPGATDRYVHIEPSGEVLRLVMEETLFFADLVQIGKNAGVRAGFAKIDKLRSNAAIITALDSTDGPLLVSRKVLDYVRSNWLGSYELQRRVLAADTGPTALRNDQGQIMAVTQLWCAEQPRSQDR